MNDNDIIKALEYCTNNLMCADECPYNAVVCCVRGDSLDLIKSQKAEIERLTEDLDEMADRLAILLWNTTGGMLSKSNYTKEVMVSVSNDYIQKCCEEAETEAIKEFAERLHCHCLNRKEQEWNKKVAPASWADAYEEFDGVINEFLEEMVGERE